MALRERREEVDTASGLLADDAKAIEDTAAEIAVERYVHEISYICAFYSH